MSERKIQRLQRLTGALRGHGSSHVLELACAYHYIPTWLVYLHRTTILRLPPGPAHDFRLRHGYSCGAAGPEHIDELAALTPAALEYRRALFLRFFHQQGSCYVIRKGKHIVAYNWVFPRRYTVTSDGYRRRQLHLVLSDGERVFGNGYIAPEHRMKGLFPTLVQTAINHHRATTVFFTTVEHLNDRSLRAHQRFGFRLFGTLTCQRIFCSPYYWTWKPPQGGRRLLGFGTPSISICDLDEKRGATPELRSKVNS